MKGRMRGSCLAVASILMVGGAASCGWLGKQSGANIRLSGNIELTETSIAFKTAGKLVELPVGEGDEVKKGMVVARRDREQLLSQKDRANSVLMMAQSRLAQLLTAIRLQSETVGGQIDQRRAELAQAEARLGQLVAGSRSQEIAQARALVAKARSEHELAKSDWERARALSREGDISARQYEESETRFQSTRASLRQAEEQLALVEEGPRKEDIEAAKAQVAAARAGLRLAEAQRLEVTRKRQETEAVQAEIDRAKAEVAVLESQLRDTEAVSPIDGLVLLKVAEVGEVVAAGANILTVGDITRPWLRAYIAEGDLGRVKIGDRAKVTTDSYPGKVYEGRVSFISSEAEFTPKQIQTSEERVRLVYRIKIDLDNPGGELKSNMPADAEIVVN